MRSSLGHYLLCLLGALCGVAGFLAWSVMVWKAFSGGDDVTPQGGGGERLLVWGLSGTLLVIAGMVLLHVAADAADAEDAPERGVQE